MNNPALKPSACRSCGAQIVWLKTSKGSNMPVDVVGVKPEETIFEPQRHVSHFATCPNAAAHRKERPK